jgi:hypothetical protein
MIEVLRYNLMLTVGAGKKIYAFLHVISESRYSASEKGSSNLP